MNREQASLLAHDVGKYVARIARNVPAAGPFPSALGALLVKDLYELPGGKTASERFAELTSGDDLAADLVAVRDVLQEIDDLQPKVRAGDGPACQRACALALRVESALRAFARQAS